jgi:hypothetical protein
MLQLQFLSSTALPEHSFCPDILVFNQTYCEIWDSQGGACEHLSLLGFYAVSSGKYSPIDTVSHIRRYQSSSELVFFIQKAKWHITAIRWQLKLMTSIQYKTKSAAVRVISWCGSAKNSVATQDGGTGQPSTSESSIGAGTDFGKTSHTSWFVRCTGAVHCGPTWHSSSLEKTGFYYDGVSKHVPRWDNNVGVLSGYVDKQ